MYTKNVEALKVAFINGEKKEAAMEDELMRVHNENDKLYDELAQYLTEGELAVLVAQADGVL